MMRLPVKIKVGVVIDNGSEKEVKNTVICKVPLTEQKVSIEVMFYFH